MNATLPYFDVCLDLYRIAYDQQGTDSFVPNELDWYHPEHERDRILDLAVAYSLLTTDGTVYSVTCKPDASAECWESVAEDRADRVKQALSTPDGDKDSDAGRQSLTYDGEEYASVRVEDGDNFAAVAEAVSDVRLDRWKGVVLRSPGDYANEVQRFADRFEESTNVDNVPLSTPLRKEYSDVEGSSKDALEFRLFLSKP